MPGLLYLRTKGELEDAVSQLDWPSLAIVRPGAILGDRAEPRWGERITAVALQALGPILPKRYQGNPAENIARALLDAAVSGALGKHIVSADQLT